MRTIVLLGMAMLAGGCTVTDREDRARYYTAAEIDAITSSMQCRQTARNLLQLMRCDTWRR
jgi:hypothetical protein